MHVPVSVEVSVTDVMHGVLAIEGNLIFEDEALTFNYCTKGFLGQWSAPTVLEIPLDSVREIALKWWKTRLVIYPSQLGLLQHVPGAHPDALTFRVKARGRKQAAALVEQVQPWLAEPTGRGIPFRLPDAALGLTELRGLLYLEEDLLVFDVGMGLPGGSRKHRKVVKIEPAALADVQVEKGTRTDRLYVTPKRRDLLEAMPGSYEDHLPLAIHQRHRSQVEQLLEEVQQLRQKMRSGTS